MLLLLEFPALLTKFVFPLLCSVVDAVACSQLGSGAALVSGACEKLFVVLFNRCRLAITFFAIARGGS